MEQMDDCQQALAADLLWPKETRGLASVQLRCWGKQGCWTWEVVLAGPSERKAEMERLMGEWPKPGWGSQQMQAPSRAASTQDRAARM